MPDITMCKGSTEVQVCPLRLNCYRFCAEPNEYWQAYFVGIPYDESSQSCEFYWPMKINNKEVKLCHTNGSL